MSFSAKFYAKTIHAPTLSSPQYISSLPTLPSTTNYSQPGIIINALGCCFAWLMSHLWRDASVSTPVTGISSLVWDGQSHFIFLQRPNSSEEELSKYFDLKYLKGNC